MPYNAPGIRHEVDNAVKACVHGQIVEEDGFIGAAFKTVQPDRWTKPGTAVGQAQHIPVNEDFTIMIGGIQEAPATGNLATAVIGSDIYINSTDNTLGLAAQGLTTGNLNATWRPVGKVTEIDTLPNPDRLKINCNVGHLVKVGTGG